jgi:hypothetical protein
MSFLGQRFSLALSLPKVTARPDRHSVSGDLWRYVSKKIRTIDAPRVQPAFDVRKLGILEMHVCAGQTRQGAHPNAERPDQTSRSGRFDPQFVSGSSFESEARVPGSSPKLHDASDIGWP